MGLFGTIITLIVGSIVGGTVWFLETINWYTLAFRVEQYNEIATRFVRWEDSVNRTIGETVGVLNQTLDAGSSGLLSLFSNGFRSFADVMDGFAGVGVSFANTSGYFSDKIPGVVMSAIEQTPGASFIIDVFSFLGWLIFEIPGGLISFLFGGLGNIAGYVAGVIEFFGMLTGFQTTIAVVGILMIVLGGYLMFSQLSSFQILLSPGTAVQEGFNGFLMAVIGGTFILYVVFTTPAALMMVGAGALFLFAGLSQDHGQVAMYGLVLLVIGVPSFWMGLGVGYLATIFPLAPATFFGVLWLINHTDQEFIPRIDEGGSLL